MKELGKMSLLMFVILQFASCSKDEMYPFTDTYYIINESSHQVNMSEINHYEYPDSINLSPADSVNGGSHMWSFTDSYYDVYDRFFTAKSMTITIDGVFSYAVSSYPGTNSCSCHGCSCKCGELTYGGNDVVCMCNGDVINPCDKSNWVLVSIEGAKIEDNVIRISKKKKNLLNWSYIITEEMAERTLSLLAEVQEQI